MRLDWCYHGRKRVQLRRCWFYCSYFWQLDNRLLTAWCNLGGIYLVIAWRQLCINMFPCLKITWKWLGHRLALTDSWEFRNKRFGEPAAKCGHPVLLGLLIGTLFFYWDTLRNKEDTLFLHRTVARRGNLYESDQLRLYFVIFHFSCR